MFRSELAQALKAMDLSVSESQLAQFCTFDEALVETNKVMNLTAITDPKGVAIKHMADSLSCYDPAYFKDGASVLDLARGQRVWLKPRQVKVFPVAAAALEEHGSGI